MFCGAGIFHSIRLQFRDAFGWNGIVLLNHSYPSQATQWTNSINNTIAIIIPTKNDESDRFLHFALCAAINFIIFLATLFGIFTINAVGKILAISANISNLYLLMDSKMLTFKPDARLVSFKILRQRFQGQQS
jgi:hypothetical protein